MKESPQLATLYPDHLKTIQSRHDRSLAENGFDRLVIYGGSQHMIFLDDMPYPFKVNPHFKAWIPVLSNPHCFLSYSPGSRPLLLYYQPIDYWHKPAENPTGYWVGSFDVKMISTPEEARAHLEANGKRSAFVGELDPIFEEWNLGDRNPAPLVDSLHFGRSQKTPYEIECMRIANGRSVTGHRAAEKAFREGASEYEIHLAYLRASGHAEQELPYGNIIALNENGAVLHYQHLGRERPSGDDRHSFLIDAGASCNGYASDITRTYSSRADEFAEFIDAVDQAQLEIVARVKPGIDYKDIHLFTHQRLGQVLHDFKFVTTDADDMVDKGITSTFFPHGVGHFIGLQVHDVAGFMADASGKTIPKPQGHPFLRLTRVIEENHVFTIEPGLYFIDSLLAELRKSENSRYVNWPKVESFRKFGGVRIEDDIVVTKDGFENLTRDQFAAQA